MHLGSTRERGKERERETDRQTDSAFTGLFLYSYFNLSEIAFWLRYSGKDVILKIFEIIAF
jgi:hypothetical protein